MNASVGNDREEREGGQLVTDQDSLLPLELIYMILELLWDGYHRRTAVALMSACRDYYKTGLPILLKDLRLSRKTVRRTSWPLNLAPTLDILKPFAGMGDLSPLVRSLSLPALPLTPAHAQLARKMLPQLTSMSIAPTDPSKFVSNMEVWKGLVDLERGKGPDDLTVIITEKMGNWDGWRETRCPTFPKRIHVILDTVPTLNADGFLGMMNATLPDNIEVDFECFGWSRDLLKDRQDLKRFPKLLHQLRGLGIPIHHIGTVTSSFPHRQLERLQLFDLTWTIKSLDFAALSKFVAVKQMTLVKVSKGFLDQTSHKLIQTLSKLKELKIVELQDATGDVKSIVEKLENAGFRVKVTRADD